MISDGEVQRLLCVRLTLGVEASMGTVYIPMGKKKMMEDVAGYE